MHELLADWLLDIQVSGKSHRTTIPLWAAGINDLIASPSAEVICDLIALAFGTPAQNVPSASYIRRTFKTHDSIFRMKDDYALQVLSGATLLTLLAQSRSSDQFFKRQSLAASAIMTSSFGKLKLGFRPPELLQKAIEFVNEEALTRRVLLDATFDDNVKELNEAHNRIRQSSIKLDDPTPQQIKDFAKIAKPVFNLLPLIPSILHNQNILQEESEIAWWVLSGYSRTTDTQFKKLPSETFPFIAAYELAERTRVIPSGIATHYLIRHTHDHAGHIDNAVSLNDIIPLLPPGWINSVYQQLGPIRSPTVTPLLYCIEQFINRGTRWEENYQEVTYVEPDKHLLATEFGYMFYQECLVIRMQRKL